MSHNPRYDTQNSLERVLCTRFKVWARPCTERKKRQVAGPKIVYKVQEAYLDYYVTGRGLWSRNFKWSHHIHIHILQVHCAVLTVAVAYLSGKLASELCAVDSYTQELIKLHTSSFIWMVVHSGEPPPPPPNKNSRARNASESFNLPPDKIPPQEIHLDLRHWSLVAYSVCDLYVSV